MGLIRPEYQKVLEGFKINGMQMKDADSGEVLWSCDNWDMSVLERDEHFPARITKCRAVTRQINFSSKEEINDFNLTQIVSLAG